MSRYSDDVPASQDEFCEVVSINAEKCSEIKDNLPSGQKLDILADLHKAFADPTRIKILTALSISELCVCDLAEIAGVSQSAVSHQLRFLRMARLVKYRKDGKMSYYSLDDEHVRALLAIGLSHIEEVV